MASVGAHQKNRRSKNWSQRLICSTQPLVLSEKKRRLITALFIVTNIPTDGENSHTPKGPSNT